MAHAAILRSPHGHARIRSIDTSAAKAAAGVVGRVYRGGHQRRAAADPLRVAAAQRGTENDAVSGTGQGRRALRRRRGRRRRRRVGLPGVRRARPHRGGLRAAGLGRRSACSHAARGTAASSRGAGQPGVPLDGGGWRHRRRVQQGGGRHSRPDHPAAADSDRHGAARRGRAVLTGNGRAHALEHHTEPAHRPLHHVARDRRSRRTGCGSSRRKWAAASAARFRRSRATSSRYSVR